MPDYVDTFNLELELAQARLVNAKLHKVLGRVLETYPAPITVSEVIAARQLYEATVLPPNDHGVMVGSYPLNGAVIAVRERLVHAGLTAKAAQRVARQPLAMPVKLGPGIVLSVFKLVT
jgi:hypothetical protein